MELEKAEMQEFAALVATAVVSALKKENVLGIGIGNGSTNEAEPVRHGRWIETPRLYYGAKQYECSLCYSDTFWNKHCITEKYPHCPNCGAKMDGDVKND